MRMVKYTHRDNNINNAQNKRRGNMKKVTKIICSILICLSMVFSVPMLSACEFNINGQITETPSTPEEPKDDALTTNKITLDEIKTKLIQSKATFIQKCQDSYITSLLAVSDGGVDNYVTDEMGFSVYYKDNTEQFSERMWCVNNKVYGETANGKKVVYDINYNDGFKALTSLVNFYSYFIDESIVLLDASYTIKTYENGNTIIELDNKNVLTSEEYVTKITLNSYGLVSQLCLNYKGGTIDSPYLYTITIDFSYNTSYTVPSFNPNEFTAEA